MRRTRIIPAYRWRLLAPQQEAAVRKAYEAGVRVPALAAEYGVDKRTIYRTLARAAGETHHDVRLGDWHARFCVTDEGPVQTSQWRPVAEALERSA